MINLFAISLIITTLAAAGIWSPPPSDSSHRVREGHRIIVVEYERDFPEETHVPEGDVGKNVLEGAKEKYNKASNYMPNVGQGISMPESENNGEQIDEKSKHPVKDLICDAYGNCKEKISTVFQRGKDKIAQKASDIEESAKDAVEKSKEKVSDVKDAVVDKVDEKAADVKETAKDTVEKAKQKASDVKESTKGAVDKTKQKAAEVKESTKGMVDKTKQKASDIKEGAESSIRNTVETTKETVRNAATITKEAGEDIAGNISQNAAKAKSKAEEAVHSVYQNLSEIVSHAKNVASDAASYIISPELRRTVSAILHLLAFSITYGTSVWVTFVSSHVLANSLPKQQFGMVQSKLYPVYFRLFTYGIGLSILGQFFEKQRMGKGDRVQTVNLLTALGLAVVNMNYLEPRATKAFFEKMKMEREEGRGGDLIDIIDSEPIVASTTTASAVKTKSTTEVGVTKTTVSVDQEELVKSRVAKLNEKLKKRNSYSSFVNIITLMSLSWHLVHLARGLQISC